MKLDGKSLREKVFEIQIRLMSQDRFAKPAVCDECLELIKLLDDKDAALELKRMLIPHLIDLGRVNDLKACAESLSASDDYHYQLCAYQVYSMIAKRDGDFVKCIDFINQGIGLAERHNDKMALVEGYFMRSKEYIACKRYDEALTELNRLIPLAVECNNYNLIAASKYYIGVVLFAMGHDSLGKEKLREASNLAHEQGCREIIMHTEVVRALFLLREGQNDVAKRILASWYDEFGMML